MNWPGCYWRAYRGPIHGWHYKLLISTFLQETVGFLPG